MVEVVLERCNLVDNQYQNELEVLYSFTLKKSYDYLLNVEPKNLVFLKTLNKDFKYITVTYTDQNGRPIYRTQNKKVC